MSSVHLAIGFLAWAMMGVAGIWIGTPAWMRRGDPVGFGFMHLCAAAGGGLLLLAVLLENPENHK